MSNLNGVYSQTPLNTSQISQQELNIAKKFRSNPLPWTGQFSPQLVEVLIKEYAHSNSSLLDPFLGSGTLLLEAGRVGLQAQGVEINPAAIAVAQLYHFINVPRYVREACLRDLDEQIRIRMATSLPLFTTIDPSTIYKTEKWTLLSMASGTMSIHHKTLLNASTVMLDNGNGKTPRNRALANWKRLHSLVDSLPYSESLIQAIHADARDIPIDSSSIDLVITSPPYINVFNYHQRHRSAIEDLNWNPLFVAKSEFGANRKHRSNRFLTVIQYCLDMYETLVELNRVCVNGAHLILVLGKESRVRGVPFYNGEIVAEVANRSLGLELVLRQERQFVNRFGNIIREDILHFETNNTTINSEFQIEEARAVAQHVLSSALEIAKDDVRDNISLALRNIETVTSSPVFDSRKAQIIPRVNV